MQFPTLEFAVFFVVTLTLAWLLKRHRTIQKLVLLAASYFFYSVMGWNLVLILALSSVSFWLSGEGIARAGTPALRRASFLAGVVLNLGLLGVFKYYNFFQESVADLASMLGLTSHLPILEILMPVGISFYVFQGLSYIIELNRGGGIRARSLPDFLLYMAFFPQFLAGPICRPKELLAQIMGPAPENVPDVSRAASLILSGLFKKAVLAHFISQHLVMAMFNSPDNYTAAALWAGMLGYTFQLYWDFSGYTDLARGTGLLLGFRIPENFDHPYIATDISDFWRRWHITLSFWLRDYLFLPLANLWSGGLRGRGLTIKQSALWGSQFALLVTFILCGLWHGAGWTFVLWGAYHGVLLFIHHGMRNGLKWRFKAGLAGKLGTLLLVAFGWVLFNADSFGTARVYFMRMFSPGAEGEGFMLMALVLIALGLYLQFTGARFRSGFIALSEQLPWAVRPVLWLAVGLIILALKPSGISPFIYFSF